MKILVTGADGFIGSHLVERLLSQGQQVRALSYYNSFNHWGWLEELRDKSGLEVVCGDVRDARQCKSICEGIDQVVHMAALIAIPYSYLAPESYIETNIKGTYNVCLAALEAGVKRILCTSTSEVYGSAKYVPIDENHPLQPQSPYSASKIGADAIALSFHNAFDLPLTIIRPFNTYGPRQSARAIIPTTITQIAHGCESIKLGDTTPTRDFNYVDDICEGIVGILACEDTVGETLNIGSNSEISILETVKLIIRLMGRDVRLQTDDIRLRPKKSEVHRLWCDNSKLSSMTGYRPKTSLEEGLASTIAWFTSPGVMSKYKPNQFNL